MFTSAREFVIMAIIWLPSRDKKMRKGVNRPKFRKSFTTLLSRRRYFGKVVKSRRPNSVFFTRFFRRGTRLVSTARRLASVFGLGFARIRLLTAFWGLPIFFRRCSPLVRCLADLTSPYFVAGRALKKVYAGAIMKKKKIGSYVGIRLKQNLPSRGQRTRANA